MINKILYINPNLNMQPIYNFPDTTEYIFIDVQPRNNNHIKDYNKNFYKDLIDLYEINGFILMETIDIDTMYYKKHFCLWYYFCKKTPEYINPTLLCFFNMDRNQVIKYFISTNIKYNINSDIIYEIKTCDAIIVNDYNDIVKLFDYIDTMKIFIAYDNIKGLSHNKDLSQNINKYIYINSINKISEFIKYDDFYLEFIFDITDSSVDL